MNAVKRERWTEGDLDALPTGEHNYFERKSGQLFIDKGELLGKLAKTISALANTGGGHILLGVDDHGVPDGVPPLQGRTLVRDWLEQVIPNLVAYPLADFRVHLVERSTPSRIPTEREVIVIDVGDSALAPHQCIRESSDARKFIYYYREAGRSVPATHFHLELLRQRLVSPALEVELVAMAPRLATNVEGATFLATQLRFLIKNVGRVAAYKWQLDVRERRGHPEGRFGDYRSRGQDFPPGAQPDPGGISLDDTILPDCERFEEKHFGFLLRPAAPTTEAVRAEVDEMILAITLGYRLATETSPGEMQYTELKRVADAQELTDFVLQDR